MATDFMPARADGRSDRQVVLDLVGDSEPETLFTYDDLVAALSVGLDRPVIRRKRVYQSVGSANTLLLRERHRFLSVVRDIGYRVIRADEHVNVAIDKKSRAEKYISRGVQILRDAKVSELSDAERALHQGQLLIMTGLLAATRESERRHNKSEALIADLKRGQEELSARIADLEGNG